MSKTPVTESTKTILKVSGDTDLTRKPSYKTFQI